MSFSDAPELEPDGGISTSEAVVPYVSIIIPAHNASQTISKTLESVLAQTFPYWEVVVVDDGSKDGTAEVVKPFADRDRRIRMVSQNQGGEAAARNAGLALVRYEWLLFLDADDWISPSHLELMMQKIKSDPELSAVHCRSARVAEDGTVVLEKYSPPIGDLFPTLARRAAFPVNACIVRKSLVESVGKFDSSFVKSPDWDLWQRISRTGARFGAVPEVLAFYRMTRNAASLDADQMLRDGLRVLKLGHGPDPRVPNPHPDYAAGMPSDQIATQQYYLLAWCAGLLLGNGKDPQHLIEMMDDSPFPELYPDAIAQCIFESAPLPACKSAEAFEEMFFKIIHDADQFLIALEKKSKAPDLARKAGIKLRRMILEHSMNWKSLIDEYDQEKETLTQSKKIIEDLLHELQSQIDNSERNLREKEIQNTELQKRLENQEQLTENVREELRDHQTKFSEFQDSKAREIEGLQQGIVGLQSERNNLQNEHDSLKKQHDNLQAEANHIREERDQLWAKTKLWKARYMQLRTSFLVRFGLKLRLTKNPMISEGKISAASDQDQ
jgi:hypothetical protein